MKWYKHDSNANCDAKLKKMRLKYGMEGYGLYWYCLELIAQNVEKHNLRFELEHDVEIIAADTNIHFERVQEMMVFMVELGLFENSDGLITCLKMATRADEYTQKLLRSRESVPTLPRHSPDKVPPNRIEENRTDKKEHKKTVARFTPPTVEEISSYISEKGYQVNAVAFFNHYESNGWMVGKNKMKKWQAAITTWQTKERGNANGINQQDTRGRAKRVADRLDDIARADIEKNGFTNTLDN